MPYLMGGFPDAATSRRVARAYADAGADLIELGIPFSDPLADGPVIHAAATAALEAGATLETALEACSAVAADVPVVAMVYSNMILAGGEAEFAARLAEAGAAGAIVPDLPLGEGQGIREAFAAPASPWSRWSRRPPRPSGGSRSAPRPRASSTWSRRSASPASAMSCRPS